MVVFHDNDSTWIRWIALQAAMDSTTHVAVMKLKMARIRSKTDPAAQPAEEKAAGSANAPVPTIKLKM